MSREIRRFKNFLIDASNIFINDKKLNDNLFYRKGDKYSSRTQVSLAGSITTSSKDILIDYHFEKDISNVSVSLDSLRGHIRGIKGYILQSTELVGNKEYSFKIEKIDSHSVHITISKSAAFDNATNNTPVTLQVMIEFSFS